MDDGYLKELLKMAQNGDKIAEDNLISYIKDYEMRKRIGRYMHRNRQAEDEDIKQEFLIGVALSISKANLEIGNPIEYIISQGVFRARSYLRKHIIQNTTQICKDCGYESRLNRIAVGVYKCKKCGSTHVETREVYEHDDLAIESKTIDSDVDIIINDISSRQIIEEFRNTLDRNTKVYYLFALLYDENINSDNPLVGNYIAEIAKRWNTSQTLVVQTREKLRLKLIKFCDNRNIKIQGDHFLWE